VSIQIDGKNHGGEVVFTGHADDDYIAQVSYTRNSGRDGALYVRYLDGDNWYRLLLDYNGGTPKARVQLMLKGKLSTLESVSYTDAASVALKVKVAGSSIKSWVDGSLKNNVALDATELIPWGAVALSGWQAHFDDLKVGYDGNNDDDIDDTGTNDDHVVISEDFQATTVTLDDDHDNPPASGRISGAP